MRLPVAYRNARSLFHRHGWVLVAYAIQFAIAVGDQVFDFMQGNEDYKYRFGSQDYAVMRVLVSRHA